MKLYNFYVKSLCVARKAGRCNGQAAVVAARPVAHCWAACSGPASKYGRLRLRQRTAGGHEAEAAASKDD